MRNKGVIRCPETCTAAPTIDNNNADIQAAETLALTSEQFEISNET